MKECNVLLALERKHRGDGTFLTHVKDGPTMSGTRIMDAVYIAPSFAHPSITIYEVKTSRADFLADSKWPDYLPLCHRFSFVSPTGVLTKDDILSTGNPRVGLITVNEFGVCRTVVKPVLGDIRIDPMFLLYIIINRVASDRTPFFSHKRDLIEAWLADRKYRGALSVEFKSALVQEMNAATIRAERAETRSEGDLEILELLDKHRLRDRWALAVRLDLLAAIGGILSDAQKLHELRSCVSTLHGLFTDEPADQTRIVKHG